MAVSDLTNTTWEISQYSYDISSMSSTYFINFTSNNYNFTSINFSGRVMIEGYYDNTQVYVDGWVDDNYRIITITGGTDATNSDLIAWLEANAVQQVAPTPSTTNNIFFGTSAINKVYFGTSEVSKIYYGNTLIYEVGGGAVEFS